MGDGGRRWRIYVIRVCLPAVTIMVTREIHLTAATDQQSHRPGEGDDAERFYDGVVREVGDVNAGPHHELPIIVVSFAWDVRQLAKVFEAKKTAVMLFGGDPATEADAIEGQRDVDWTAV